MASSSWSEAAAVTSCLATTRATPSPEDQGQTRCAGAAAATCSPAGLATTSSTAAAGNDELGTLRQGGPIDATGGDRFHCGAGHDTAEADAPGRLHPELWPDCERTEEAINLTLKLDRADPARDQIGIALSIDSTPYTLDASLRTPGGTLLAHRRRRVLYHYRAASERSRLRLSASGRRLLHRRHGLVPAVLRITTRRAGRRSGTTAIPLLLKGAR